MDCYSTQRARQLTDQGRSESYTLACNKHRVLPNIYPESVKNIKKSRTYAQRQARVKLQCYKSNSTRTGTLIVCCVLIYWKHKAVMNSQITGAITISISKIQRSYTGFLKTAQSSMCRGFLQKCSETANVKTKLCIMKKYSVQTIIV